MPAHTPKPLARRYGAGFTLMEMLVVITIIGILAAALLSVYQQMRKITWKQQTRNMTRQLSLAWKMRVQNKHEWPDATRFDSTFTTLASGDAEFVTSSTNMAALNFNADGSSDTYFELNANQIRNGLVDYWHHFLHVRLDLNSDGQIPNPADETKVIYSSAVVWSWGAGGANTPKDWVVSF